MSATKVKMPLSGNVLKLIGALAMLCDHTGMLLFPQVLWLRMVGRLAFPIFAFFIAEGCRHTRNRTRYLCTVAFFALAFQVVYFIATKDTRLSIFTTFTVSILLIYLLDAWKNSFLRECAKAWQRVLLGIGFFLSVGGVYALNRVLTIDYGFFGCMTPLFASLVVAPKDAPEKWRKIDVVPLRLLTMALPLIGHSIWGTFSFQYLSLLAIPLLLLYSGKRGKYNLKYFFYAFYPLHIVILYGIALLLNG